MGEIEGEKKNLTERDLHYTNHTNYGVLWLK